jgi:ligand-binding sensor domain-containing protein
VQAWAEEDGLASNTIRALYEDAHGILWIGTYDGGLGRFEKDRFTSYTVREGLFNNGVFQILEDSRGNFWMSCNRGIYRVSKRQLNDFAAGRTKSISSIEYGRQDGMRNIECNGGLWPAGIKTQDGRLWFPTQDGVAVIDPQKLATPPAPPPVVIESCLIDHTPMAINGPVRVTPEHDNVEIQYSALSFINSEHIRFRYQLHGLDRDWVAAGTRRTAYYPHLPAGRYTFSVTAAHSDGVWNGAGTSLTILVLPRFYRTQWFSILS